MPFQQVSDDIEVDETTAAQALREHVVEADRRKVVIPTCHRQYGGPPVGKATEVVDTEEEVHGTQSPGTGLGPTSTTNLL